MLHDLGSYIIGGGLTVATLFCTAVGVSLIAYDAKHEGARDD